MSTTIYTGLGAVDDVEVVINAGIDISSDVVQVAVGSYDTVFAVGANPTWLTPDTLTFSAGGTVATATLIIGNGFINPTAGTYWLWYRVVDGPLVKIQPVRSTRFTLTATEGDEVNAVPPWVATVNNVQPDETGNVEVSGGGSGIPVGDPQTYTFQAGDATDPASWYGSGALVHVLPTWTPEYSGTVYLLPPPDNGDPDAGSFEFRLWVGDVLNVDYPDESAASGSVDGTDVHAPTGAPFVGVSAPLEVVAGQAYTPIVTNWGGTVGATVDLSTLYVALGSFGGLDLAPQVDTGLNHALALVEMPDGTFALRPVVEVDVAGTAQNVEGDYQNGTVELGWYARREGDNAWASVEAADSATGHSAKVHQYVAPDLSSWQSWEYSGSNGLTRATLAVYSEESAGIPAVAMSFDFEGDDRVQIGTEGINTKRDIEVKTNTRGLILKSPDGTRYRLKVANDGTLSTEAV